MPFLNFDGTKISTYCILSDMNFFMKNRYLDPDPDPRQNEMDPKRCSLN